MTGASAGESHLSQRRCLLVLAVSCITIGAVLCTMASAVGRLIPTFNERKTSEERGRPQPQTSVASVRTSVPSDAPRRTTRDSSDAPAKAEVEARLTEADLNEEEKEAARRAARHTVDEALKQPGGIPPLFPHKLPESCTVIVEGLPLVGPKQQRCCKVDFNNQVYLRSVRAEEEAARIANGGAQDKHDQLERSSDNDEEDPDGGGLRRRRAKSRRLVEVDAAADAGPDGDGNAEGRKSATLPIDPIEHGASSDPKVVCYPSFVIAGTQKSGTTALTAILEQHPSVRMAARKELHFFDNKPQFSSSKMQTNYPYNFPSFNASLATRHSAPYISGEATPFYLASRNACQNLRQLLPDVRLIILVRDPVKRAYSEYQMKVRRVREQEEMFKLMERDAAKVYSCFVEAFPSAGQPSTSRERELLWFPFKITKAIGDCAGEVGDHGKWMEVMFGFVSRAKAIMKGAKEASVLAGRGGVEEALEGLREDANRCFPLVELADQAEKRHPGGKWRANWRLSEMKSNKHAPGEDVGHSKLSPPLGNRGGALRHSWRKDGGRNLVGVDDENSAIEFDEEGHGAEHYLDHEHSQWRGSHHARGDGAPVEYTTYNQTLYRWLHRTFDQLDHPQHSKEQHSKEPSTRHGANVWGNDPLWHATPHAVYLNPDMEVGLEPGWLDLCEQEAAHGRGWHEPNAARHYSDSHEPGDGYHLSPASEEGGGRYYGEGKQGIDQVSQVDVDRRKLPVLDPGKPTKDVGATMDWGEWGQKGDRMYDKTCYVKHEKVLGADTVMRKEIKTVTKCFEDALTSLGGLAEVDEINTEAALEAMDGCINRCFTVTPGISMQYLYRSLYSVQAYHCLRHFPRDQMLFIESDDLRERPQEVLSNVHEFIGVPEFSYPSLDQEIIMQELNKKYPDFEKKTGWRLDSEYKEMPEALAHDVREFLQPHMTLFARLVGQSFGDWAVDDKNGQEAIRGEGDMADNLFKSEYDMEIQKVLAAKKSHPHPHDASGGVMPPDAPGEGGTGSDAVGKEPQENTP